MESVYYEDFSFGGIKVRWIGPWPSQNHSGVIVCGLQFGSSLPPGSRSYFSAEAEWLASQGMAMVVFRHSKWPVQLATHAAYVHAAISWLDEAADRGLRRLYLGKSPASPQYVEWFDLYNKRQVVGFYRGDPRVNLPNRAVVAGPGDAFSAASSLVSLKGVRRRNGL